AFATLNAVGEAGQRLFGVPRQKQVTRVRIDVERVGTKSEKFFVHTLALDPDVLVLFGRRRLTSPPETAVSVAVGRGLDFFLTQPGHGNQERQIHDGGSILGSADRLVAELQNNGDDQTEAQADTQAAGGENRAVRETGSIGRTGRGQNVHLFALLIFLHVG